MKTKKILCCMRYGFPASGGAEISMLTLSKKLSLDYGVKIFSLEKYNKKGFYSGIPYTCFDFQDMIPKKSKPEKEYIKRTKIIQEDYLSKEVLDYNPDVILSQHGFSFLIADLIKTKKIKSKFLIFIHGYGYLNIESSFFGRYNKEHENARMIYGKSNEKSLFSVLSTADKICMPSIFLRNFFPKRFTEKICIQPPFINLKKFFLVNKNQKRMKITHINPSISKGIDLTLSLAKELRDESFLICGGQIEKDILNQINYIKNAEYHGISQNMEKIYAQSKLVLMPSRRPETFGMVSIEAQSAGCNVIVSDNGGIIAPRESYISVDAPINEWIKKIKEGGHRFNKREIEKFNIERTYSNFRKNLEDLI